MDLGKEPSAKLLHLLPTRADDGTSGGVYLLGPSPLQHLLAPTAAGVDEGLVGGHPTRLCCLG